jgi:two-component system sensor histidine kinase PilS (NtrC family)
VHICTLLGFTSGVLPAFGLSGREAEVDPVQLAYVLAFSSLQILGATLVVVLIRRSMQSLRRTLTESEAAVGDLSALYRRVVDSLFSGLITTDLEGRITSANPAAEVILKRTLPPGIPLSEVLPADLGIEAGQARERRFECTLRIPDGSSRIIGGNVAPLRGAERGRTGFLLLFQDLTEIKELEERTRLSERLAAVGELSAGLAHELRNPLASILGSVQILRQQGQSQAMLDRVLGILGRESERVSAILTDFLDYARPRPLKPRSLWLPDLVRELKESWDTDSRNRSLPLQVPNVPWTWIAGDPLSFHQVFTNLLSNARKAIEGLDSASVRMELNLHEDHLEAVVSDTGHGMQPEQLERIFVPFSSSFREGTGLGMSLVYQYAHRQGWDLRVQSSPGVGTSVHVRIPLAEPDPARSAESG